jgi:cytochrome c oxidase subunit 3
LNTLYHPAPSPYADREHHALANHLGMWTFLATEILFFGGLFASYSIYRYAYPEAFRLGSEHLEYWIGTTNTGVLLTSSLFVALADLAVKANARRAVRWNLLAAWVLGAVFLCLKFYEYYKTYEEHHVPGINFEFAGPHAPQVALFMVHYFAMTALHALHMMFGLAAIAWLLWLNHRGRLGPERDQPVAIVGLYWHFVDCIWIFLYPLLYLIR